MSYPYSKNLSANKNSQNQICESDIKGAIKRLKKQREIDTELLNALDQFLDYNGVHCLNEFNMFNLYARVSQNRKSVKAEINILIRNQERISKKSRNNR